MSENRHLIYVLLSCVLTPFQIFPTMFKPEESTSLLKVKVRFFCSPIATICLETPDDVLMSEDDIGEWD